jgi:transcriptional regulator with XRE-family HTH domain
LAGRKRKELSGTGAPAELARRLRAQRDEQDMTLRQLAAKSGYSQASLSGAESGKRVPTWELTAAFVQSCGCDPAAWRQLWETAAASEASVRTTLATSRQPGLNDIGGSQTRSLSRRTPGEGPWPRRHLVTTVLIAAASASILSIIGMEVSAAGRPRPHLAARGSQDAPPVHSASAASFSASGRPAAPYPVRRYGEVVLRAGWRIGLDTPTHTPWPTGTSGSWPPYDLEFTLADRLLVSVGTQTTGASLAWISHPTNTYDDCLTSDYGGVVPTRAIIVGTEFCVLTGERRRALGTVHAVTRDPVNGLPVIVTLILTVWDHIVPPGS